MQVNILEAKNRLSELIKSAQAGNEVIIANRGQPVVRLVAAVPVNKGKKKSLLAWLKSNPMPQHAQKTAREIDHAISQERQAWD